MPLEDAKVFLGTEVGDAREKATGVKAAKETNLLYTSYSTAKSQVFPFNLHYFEHRAASNMLLMTMTAETDRRSFLRPLPPTQ